MGALVSCGRSQQVAIDDDGHTGAHARTTVNAPSTASEIGVSQASSDVPPRTGAPTSNGQTFEDNVRLHGCGHVFILDCSIKKIAADAVLIPLAWKFGEDGLPAVAESQPELASGETMMLDVNGRLVYRAELLPRKDHSGDGAAFEPIFDAVLAYVKAASHRLNGRSSHFKRFKPLIAVPVPGTGELDPEDLMPDQGRYVQALLPILYHAANRFGVDLAALTTERGCYSIMQARTCRPI